MDAQQWNGPDEREDVCTEDAEVCPCPECVAWRSNSEPGDPDGEAFRGGESAAALIHTQAEIQRTLKR